MSNRPPASQIDHYFIHVRLLPSGDLKKTEIPAAKAFFYRQFPELTEATDSEAEVLSEIQPRLAKMIRSVAEEDTLVQMSAVMLEPNSLTQRNDAVLAECCLRCFVSHYIALVCLELEQRFRGQSGFRAVNILPYVLSDVDPLKSKQEYEESYAQEFQAKQNRLQVNSNVSKNQKFQIPLAIHIVHTFDPTKGNLIAWTKLLTPQHRELNRILAEYGIHRKTDWSILNSHNPARVRRLLSGMLTETELQSMIAVLESYHKVYRGARPRTQQAGKPCKEPDQKQLTAMVHVLKQQGIEGYSCEQVLQTLRFLALKLRHRQLELSQNQELLQNRSQPQLSAAEREQELFLQYQQELLSECLNQAVKQVLDDHIARLRQKKSRKCDQNSAKNLPKDRIFLEAMRLFYCEGKSMTEIAHRIGHQKEYQVSRLLVLKTLREQVREPWQNLTCARIDRLLKAYVEPSQLPYHQQQIEQVIAMQIDQLIAEERINTYRRQRLAHTLFAESFRSYLENSPPQNLYSQRSADQNG